MLPAVLQSAGDAPCFGTISGISGQGLIFNVQSDILCQLSVGQTAKLDFSIQNQHHSSAVLIVHVQGKQFLLSLRDGAAKVQAALLSAEPAKRTGLASQMSALQTQQTCHALFMKGMQSVIESFYRLLPEEITRQKQTGKPENQTTLARLIPLFDQLRPLVVRNFTAAYPMYPTQLESPLHAASTSQADTIDMAQVDEWITRTTLAQEITLSLDPLPKTFSFAYRNILGGDHPYHPDAVLQVMAKLIAPAQLGLDASKLCYAVLGQAFQKQALSLYENMLSVVQDSPPEQTVFPRQHISLGQWLSQSADANNLSSASASSSSSVNAEQVNELATLIDKLTQHLDHVSESPSNLASDQHTQHAISELLIPRLLARDRVFSRFVSGNPTVGGLSETLSMPGAQVALGGLTDLDHIALQGLYASMRAQNPFDLSPEKLSPGSQLRALILQAQGLLLEFTLNGLTYESEPNHPAWTLINAIDALHLGVDIHGQFLDPTLHQAISLAMQWLLGQENVEAALAQINALLNKINTQLGSERQARRAQHVASIGVLDQHASPISSGWCLVKTDDTAIPYEVLGEHNQHWALLDRSATHLLRLPADTFLQEVESGRIEETNSFDHPLLERIADATLTASLEAVHAFTWQDPASGCLKRNALMDQLERHLAHPVTEPPMFCALIEIPTMRPGMSNLPGDELAVLQKRTGEILLSALNPSEHCGRLSDVSFMMVFAPQDPAHLSARLTQLKADMEALHPIWKMTGAVVPLADGETDQRPSNTLRRVNQACALVRQEAGFDLSSLRRVLPVTNQIQPLPFESLYLRCQKIQACIDTAPSHYEILLGIDESMEPHHTTQSFVVMAEQTGSIHQLDLWVLQASLDWMNNNEAGLANISGLSINLSGNSLTNMDHVTAMADLLGGYPHLLEKIILEVTETAAIDNMETAAKSLRILKKLGCRVALDDFGSGYSSYSYMRSLPLDYLKIDGTYIRNLLNDPTDQALTASMVDVAHALGLKVIAEYVDSEAVYAWLKNLGVDYVQGYWIHKPERLQNLRLH